MALPITVPNTFATETNNIPLSDLDDNFTVLETAINGIGNGSEALANVVVTGGTINGAVIGGSNAAAGTFTTVTATTYTGGGIAPTGSLTMWAGAVASPPTGWLACNGANVSRTTYSALFAVIGTEFGIGDGATTFGLPNLVNKFAIGAGDTYAIAATGGSANSIVVSHTHTVTDPGHNHTYTMASTQTVNVPIGSPNAPLVIYSTQNTSTATTGVSIDSAGSSGTNANLPPYVAVGYIIKT